MIFTCVSCQRDLPVTASVSKPRAVCICSECVRATLDPQELQAKLNPQDPFADLRPAMPEDLEQLFAEHPPAPVRLSDAALEVLREEDTPGTPVQDPSEIRRLLDL